MAYIGYHDVIYFMADECIKRGDLLVRTKDPDVVRRRRSGEAPEFMAEEDAVCGDIFSCLFLYTNDNHLLYYIVLDGKHYPYGISRREIEEYTIETIISERIKYNGRLKNG